MEISINGRIVPLASAKVSAADMSLLHGSGLFTTARVYGQQVFRLDQHLQRLEASAKALGLNVTVELDELREWVQDLVDISPLVDARVRITVTAGDSPMVVSYQDGQSPQSAVIICVGPLFGYAPVLYEKGASAVISRVPFNTGDPLGAHKTTSYLGNLRCLQEARSAGALEALRLSGDGYVCEGAISNIAIIAGDTLITPPLSQNILPGIARSLLLELASEYELDPQERPILLDELLAAEEVLLTNSIMEVMPVVRVDRRPIGQEKVGPNTRELLVAYRERVAEELGLMSPLEQRAVASAQAANSNGDDDDDDDLPGEIIITDDTDPTADEASDR